MLMCGISLTMLSLVRDVPPLCYFFLNIFLAAALNSWRSEVYDHYTLSVHRDATSDPGFITYVFTCIDRPDLHPPQYRLRSNTQAGTGNLNKSLRACFLAQGLPLQSRQSGAAGNTSQATLQYSEAAHRALNALRCAKSLRPFNSVADPDYHEELRMLRPNITLITPQKVSRDINAIYLAMSFHVKQYFKVSYTNMFIHLILML